jgi:hypothetical protein
MSDEHNHLAESGVTLHSDSELYSAGDDLSSPPSSNSPVILYKPPTVWSLIRGAAINLLLPFVNGMMLGFGELFAHEAAFRLGWGGTKVCHTMQSSKLSTLTHKPRSSPSHEEEFTLSDLVSSFEKSHMLLALRWTILQAWSKMSEPLHYGFLPITPKTHSSL